MNNFDAILSHGESFYSTSDGNYKMHPRSSEEENQYIKELFELEESLNNMLEYIHKKYISIDIENCNDNAVKALKKEKQELNEM